jgi:hypothetical protein
MVGFVDEVTLFGRPLTAAEVARLAQAPDLLKGLK